MYGQIYLFFVSGEAKKGDPNQAENGDAKDEDKTSPELASEETIMEDLDRQHLDECVDIPKDAAEVMPTGDSKNGDPKNGDTNGHSNGEAKNGDAKNGEVNGHSNGKAKNGDSVHQPPQQVSKQVHYGTQT